MEEFSLSRAEWSPSLTKDVLEGLRAPVKSFRIFALEEAIRGGNSPILQEALAARQLEEDDEECRLLLSHALVAVKERLGCAGNSDTACGAFSPEEFSRKWASLTPPGKIGLLTSISIEQVRKLVPQIPKLLDGEENPAVIGTVLRLFAPFWSPDSLDMLVPMLSDRFDMVRMAALEILVVRDPRRLERYLPPLLQSLDPRFRSTAVQGLAAIDLDSSLEYVDEMLSAPDPWTKTCGLQSCLFLPFSRVKAMLLRFLASESKGDLVEKAGAILCTNPEPDVPFRLKEMIERSSERRRPQLKEILEKILKTLAATGSLGSDPSAFRSSLEEWGKKRSAVAFVQEVVETLSDSGEDATMLVPLAAPDSQPALQEALSQATQWEAAPKLPIPVEKLIPRGKSPVEKGETPFPGDPAADPGAVLGWFQGLSPGGKGEDFARLKSLLMEASTPDLVKAGCLKTARRLEISGCTDRAEVLLGSHDSRVVCAAMEYLKWADIDRLSLYLGKLLQAKERRVKVTALGIYKDIDSRQALSTVQHLLRDTDPRKQEMGFACLFQFDFSLVRDLLVEFLGRWDTETNWRQGLSLFQANPDSENIYALYKLEKTAPRAFSAKARQVRLETVKTLQALKVFGVAENLNDETRLEERYQKDASRKASPPPFALKTLRDTKGGRSLVEGTFGGDSGLTTRSVALLVGMACMGLFLTYAFGAAPVVESAKPGVAGAVLPRQVERAGKIVSVPGGTSQLYEFQANDGTRFLIELSRGNNPVINPGDQVKIQMTPLRVDRKGNVIARASNISVQRGGTRRKR